MGIGYRDLTGGATDNMTQLQKEQYLSREYAKDKIKHITGMIDFVEGQLARDNPHYKNTNGQLEACKRETKSLTGLAKQISYSNEAREKEIRKGR